MSGKGKGRLPKYHPGCAWGCPNGKGELKLLEEVKLKPMRLKRSNSLVMDGMNCPVAATAAVMRVKRLRKRISHKLGLESN